MGRGAELETPPGFMAQRYQHRGGWPRRLFEEQPAADLEGADSESCRQVCYYRSDVGGLECDLKGSNETLSINMLTASSNMALKSEDNPILKKALLSGHE